MHASLAHAYSGLPLVVLAVLVCSLSCSGDQSVGRGSIPGYVQSELSNASEFQREILQDGQVTPAEYERAVLSTLQCLDRSDVVHSEPKLETSGERTRWQYTYTFDKNDEERGNKIYNQCYDEFERAIVIFWGRQTAPSEQDEQELIAEFLACLEEHGLEVASVDEVPVLSAIWAADQKLIEQNCRLLIYRGEDRFPK